jgi:hypothetical protein
MIAQHIRHRTPHSHADADHGLSDVGGHLGEDGGVVVVRNGLDDGSGALGGVAGEDWAGISRGP